MFELASGRRVRRGDRDGARPGRGDDLRRLRPRRRSQRRATPAAGPAARGCASPPCTRSTPRWRAAPPASNSAATLTGCDDSGRSLLETARAVIGPVGDSRLGLAFQPVVRASGGNVISFHECLVRLRQPDGGLLRAGAFMPEIERLGLAPLVDRQVLAQTFTVLARHPSARFSINVCPQTMHDRAWMTLFDESVARDPTLAERLIVELTETGSMLDHGRTRAFMERLRGHGVSFALDDFGAGHTALHYLRDFRFDILKIDGRFVRDIRHGSDSAFLVERMIEIARHFEMMTVAEAVQSPAEARCLAELGAEHFQGFYFGSPSLMLGPTTVPMPAVAAQA